MAGRRRSKSAKRSAKKRDVGSKYPPTSLKINGITHVGLKVADAKRAGDFYGRVLGLERKSREPGILYLPSGHDVLILYEEGQGATDSHFGFNVDSPSTVDQWKAWLEKHAVPLFEEIAEDHYRSIKFQDPDGHWIEIFYEE